MIFSSLFFFFFLSFIPFACPVSSGFGLPSPQPTGFGLCLFFCPGLSFLCCNVSSHVSTVINKMGCFYFFFNPSIGVSSPSLSPPLKTLNLTFDIKKMQKCMMIGGHIYIILPNSTYPDRSIYVCVYLDADDR